MRRFSQADGFIGEVLRKLTDPSPSQRGRKMTPQGAYDRIRDDLRDRHLLSFYEVAITDDQVTVVPHDASRAWEDKIDGMLLVETTVVTAEQKDLLKRLGVPPLSGVLPESCSV